MLLRRKENYNLKDILRINFTAAPVHASLLLVQRLINGFIPAIQAVVTAMFIDTSIAILNGKQEVAEIVPIMVALVALVAYQWISGYFFRFVEIRYEIRVREKFRPEILEKWARLKYKHIENGETWDILQRVGKEPENNIMRGYTNLIDIASTFIKIGSLVGLIAAQVWWAAIILIIFALPVFYLSYRSGKERYKIWEEVTHIEREYVNYGQMLTNREAAEERAVFGFSKRYTDKWYKAYEEARIKKLHVTLRWIMRIESAGLLNMLAMFIIIVVLLQPTLVGAITVGTFMSLVNALMGLRQELQWSLQFHISELSKYFSYLKDLSVFVNLDEVDAAGDMEKVTVPEFESFEFRDVSFKYPNTEKHILKNMSFRIDSGQHCAFVGINGAGKTTVTKLLTGLFDEYEGQILINDRDIKSYPDNELKSFFSVVYQDFARYNISVRENIEVGDLQGTPDVDEVLAQMELTAAIRELPNGLETPLGKVLDGGMDLSGGQWQRIAMARAIVNPAPLQILDEPTAALDPISESKLYELFETISIGKTTIFISHRLGSTKLAQKIFVIGEGTVLESGSHEELMRVNGIYSEMYDSQRSWYQ